ncbi:MAG: hypothetical protein DI629_18545 [Mesorhizobium amorphae]|nr:MAG: hypothetical protein DI629_18545 [Mesorhizobium amorphae]
MASTIAGALRFVRWTNPLRPASMPIPFEGHEPVIVALWHGQHFMTPAFYPRTRKLAAMVSRSADAEMNALVLERFGVETVRGSGGREGRTVADKGGARALVALKRLLDRGTNVAMIADIPNGTPREAGLGIVTLAKISGRPIVPSAIATSRGKVLDRSWDKAVISLPFGRSALGFGPFVEVPADAGEEMLEEKRRELTRSLNLATERAYALARGSAVEGVERP